MMQDKKNSDCRRKVSTLSQIAEQFAGTDRRTVQKIARDCGVLLRINGQLYVWTDEFWKRLDERYTVAE